MRCSIQAVIISLGCAWPVLGHAQTVSQYITGTVAGSSVTDSLGMFGPAGASLAGRPITLYFQYVPADIAGLTGCDEPADYGCSVRYTTGRGGLTDPAVPGSILVVVGINGVRYTYAPSEIGSLDIRDATAPLAPSNMLFVGIQSLAAASKVGVSLLDLGIAYAQPVVFGKALSPSNNPLTGYKGDFISVQPGTVQPNGAVSDEFITFSVNASAQ